MDTSTPIPSIFIVNSPQELSEAITSQPPGPSAFASIAISDSQVCVRAFHFKDIPLKRTKSQLHAEAVGLLSLPLNEIELDYYLSPAGEEQPINGIFICMPSKLLKEYLAILDKAKLIPLKLTATIVPAVESFALHPDISKERCCLLDFSFPNKVNLAIFLNKQCEFLREIPYDDVAEAKNEITQTLRSACATSTIKQLDYVYCAGDPVDKEELLREIEQRFETKIERGISLDIKESLIREDSAFNLNFLKSYSFSLSKRKQILKVTHALMITVIALCLILTGKILFTQKALKDMKSSFKSSQHDQALRLEKQLKVLKDSK